MLGYVKFKIMTKDEFLKKIMVEIENHKDGSVILIFKSVDSDFEITKYFEDDSFSTTDILDNLYDSFYKNK